jgi:hypothetical protein
MTTTSPEPARQRGRSATPAPAPATTCAARPDPPCQQHQGHAAQHVQGTLGGDGKPASTA